MAYYSAKHKDKEIQKISSSGGAFTALSNVLLKENGIIVGGEYNYSTHEVEHRICRTFEERNLLRGSKYIQSNMKETFKQIRAEIKNHKRILFVGTPCQITGLKNYLLLEQLSEDSIILCDIICHGVPSPAVWKQCIKKWRNKIRFVTFKDKRLGWKRPLAFVTVKNKRKSLRKYTLLYFGGLISRPCCEKCPYASMERHSDITIGDHWGVNPLFYDKDGVSLIITNNEKGQKLFDEASEELIFIKQTKEDCYQQSLQYPTIQHPKRKKFWQLYDKNPDLAIYWFAYKIALKKIGNKIFYMMFKRLRDKLPRKPLPSLYEQSSHCCGCSACYSICPQRAIHMKPDEEGFLYPIIDTSICIHCHKCIEVCKFKKDQKKMGA